MSSNKNETVAETTYITALRTCFKYKYTWIIANAKELWKHDYYSGLKSGSIYPSLDKGIFEIYLKFEREGYAMYCKYETCIPRKENRFFTTKWNIPSLGIKDTNTGYISTRYLGSADDIGDKILNMKEDELKIEFEIFIEEIHGFENPACIKIKDGKLLQKVGDLLNDSKFTDVTIITADKKELRAHKNILAARSKVFEAMFDHELEESKLNQVYINDFNEEVIRQMLQYIYTGKLTKLDDLNADLLAIAHKYELQELEEMCVNSLLEQLSIETAAEAFKLGDLYTYQILKESAVNMMKQHAASWIREDASNEPQVLVNISEIITNLQKLKEAEDCKDEQ